MHHGLPHHPLPAACVWATLPPHDPALHGDGHQAVRHVHRRWAQRLCRLRLHVTGQCVHLELVQDVTHLLVFLSVSLSKYNYKIICFSGPWCEVFSWRSFSSWHHRRVSVQGPQPWPERRLQHCQDGILGRQEGRLTGSLCGCVVW